MIHPPGTVEIQQNAAPDKQRKHFKIKEKTLIRPVIVSGERVAMSMVMVMVVYMIMLPATMTALLTVFMIVIVIVGVRVSLMLLIG